MQCHVCPFNIQPQLLDRGSADIIDRSVYSFFFPDEVLDKAELQLLAWNGCMGQDELLCGEVVSSTLPESPPKKL